MEGNYWARRLSRRRMVGGALSAGAGVTALGLVGCGDDDDDDAAPSEASGTSTPQAGKRPSKPSEVPYGMDLRVGKTPVKRGGTLRIHQQLTVPTVDPRKNGAADPQWYFSKHASYLVTHDAQPGVGPFEEPIAADIAEKWEQPDNTTFTFKLNPKAKWQNRAPANGRAVTASDVKYTFELWKATGVTASNWESVDTVEAVDDATVRIKMKRPTPEAMDLFAFEHHAILNPEYMASKGGELGDGGVGFVGSGPFILTEWQTGVKATWERNPDYWAVDKDGTPLPYVDRLEEVWIRDPAAQVAALEGGQIGGAGIPITQFDRFARDQEYNLGKYVIAAGMGIIAFSNRTAPLNDPRVRRALSMSLNRESIRDNIFGGLAEPVAVIPPKAFGLKELPKWNEVPATWKYNPSEAKKLLEAAGYGNGLEIPFTHYHVTGSAMADLQLIAQQQFKEIGVTVNPKYLDRSAFFSILYPAKWDGIMSWVASLPGVSNQSWAEWMHSKANNNWYGINDPAVDAAVEKLRVTLDNNERKKLFEEVRKLEYDNVYRGWTVAPGSLFAYRSWYQNPFSIANGFLSYKMTAAKWAWVDR